MRQELAQALKTAAAQHAEPTLKHILPRRRGRPAPTAKRKVRPCPSLRTAVVSSLFAGRGFRPFYGKRQSACSWMKMLECVQCDVKLRRSKARGFNAGCQNGCDQAAAVARNRTNARRTSLECEGLPRPRASHSVCSERFIWTVHAGPRRRFAALSQSFPEPKVERTRRGHRETRLATI